MTGQEIAERNPQQELVARVRSDTFKEQVALALPDNMPPSRFVRATVTALLANPDIVKAEPDSIFQALLRSAQDGLLPDGREAALVMFGQKAVYMPMIGGFRKIAAEHGWKLRTSVVYANDRFEFELGMEPKLVHVPVRPGAERGEKIAAYAVGTHREHGTEIEVMYAEDIEKVRKVSRSKDSGPWRDWPERMWEKTAGRRLFAKLPLGERDQDRIRRVLDVDELRPGEAADVLYGQQDRALEAGSATLPAESEQGQRETPAEPVIEGKGSADADEPSSSSESEPAFAAPEEAANDPAVVAANKAGEVEIPSGVNKGRKIRELLDAPNGLTWLRHALRSWNPDDDFGKACWAFAIVYAPEIHEQVADEKAKAASA